LSLESLELNNFKIIKNLKCEIDKDFTLISGENGAGKTSILEAIYFSVNGKSFLTKVNSRLVNFDSNYFFIKSKINNHEIKCSYDKLENTKNFKLNNSKERILNLSLKFPFFVFHNSILPVVRGPVLESYSFFNKILLRMFPLYLQAYREYIKSLSIKRELLKKEVKNDIINSWNRVLEKRRILLTEKRFWLVKRLNNILNSEIEIKYFCNKENQKLSDFLNEEKTKKRILVGSQRDKFLIFKENREVRFFSSSGQQKMVFFDILKAVGTLFKEETNKKPVLLLDDFDSEFDKENMEKTMEKLMKNFQLIITTTDQSKYKKYNFKLLRINKGQLRSD